MTVQTHVKAGPDPDPCMPCTGGWDDEPGNGGG